jgi:hypothetical protein
VNFSSFPPHLQEPIEMMIEEPSNENLIKVAIAIQKTEKRVLMARDASNIEQFKQLHEAALPIITSTEYESKSLVS